ncbi:hypothetical protein LF252_07890 [Hymenobacter sp. BT728]|nr:hypothetical protein [Hymenobacter pini]
MLDLTHLSQQVPVWRSEARALQLVVDQHLEHLAQLSADGQLTLEQALQLKPLGRVQQQLTRMLTSRWPQRRSLVGYQPKQRQWRLSFDELLLLNRLYTNGKLALPQEHDHRLDLWHIGGEINRTAQNLTQYFKL